MDLHQELSEGCSADGRELFKKEMHDNIRDCYFEKFSCKRALKYYTTLKALPLPEDVIFKISTEYFIKYYGDLELSMAVSSSSSFITGSDGSSTGSVDSALNGTQVLLTES